MDKYRLTSTDKPTEPPHENEIRVTKFRTVSYLVRSATRALNENTAPLYIKGMGQTIQQAITVVEILKRNIAGLHQITELRSVEFINHYEPLEAGLDSIDLTRQIASITIILSSQPLDTNHYGYQAPLPADVVSGLSVDDFYPGGRRGRVRRQKREQSYRQSNHKDNDSTNESKRDIQPRDRTQRDSKVRRVNNQQANQSALNKDSTHQPKNNTYQPRDRDRTAPQRNNRRRDEKNRSSRVVSKDQAETRRDLRYQQRSSRSEEKIDPRTVTDQHQSPRNARPAQRRPRQFRPKNESSIPSTTKPQPTVQPQQQEQEQEQPKTEVFLQQAPVQSQSQPQTKKNYNNRRPIRKFRPVQRSEKVASSDEAAN